MRRVGTGWCVLFWFPPLMGFFSFCPKQWEREENRLVGAHSSEVGVRVSYVTGHAAWKRRTEPLRRRRFARGSRVWVPDMSRDPLKKGGCRCVFSPTWQSDPPARADLLTGHSALLFLSAFTRLELNSSPCYRGGHREEWPLFIPAIKTSAFRANPSPGRLLQCIYLQFCPISLTSVEPFLSRGIYANAEAIFVSVWKKKSFFRTQNALWANCN